MRIQVLVPLLLGLSVCGIGSVFVYHYLNENRRKDEDADDEASSATAASLTSVEVITMTELSIHNELVPILIGKQNLSLRSLESKTRTKITFREDTLTEDHQICRIEGTRAAVEDAERIIAHIASKPAIITEELEVSQTACGKILGRCGERLQDICRKSNAKVSVNSSTCDMNHRQVIITGTRVQVNAARALIEEKIQEDSDLRKAIEESELKRERRGPLKSLSDSQTSLSESVTSSRAERLHGGAVAGQMEVYVSAIASPSKFWLQMIGAQSTELDTLIETMTSYYDRAENQALHVIEEPCLDQIVAAMFKWDNKWYRAKIVAILPNEYNEAGMVMDIYFLDYGDSAYVAPHEVFQLRPDFLTLRFQAIECFLANVAPLDFRDQEAALREERRDLVQGVDGGGGQEEGQPPQRFKWDRRVIERFEQLTHVAQWEMLLCRVICHEEKKKSRGGAEGRKERALMGREGSPVPGVELYDNVNGLEVNVGQQLIQEGFALPATYQKGGGARLTVNGNGSQHSSRTLSPVGFGNGAANGRSTDDLSRFSAICENSSNENFENASYERQQRQ